MQPAPAGRRIHYERRRPEDTVLYQVVQEHLETFLAQVEAETGLGLPEFVKAEFEASLDEEGQEDGDTGGAEEISTM